MPRFSHPLKDSPEVLGTALSPSDIPEAIRSMTRKYNYTWTDREISPEVRNGTAKERVVVTGTTGALGSYLLAALLHSNDVQTVWALNRKSKQELMARQKASFEDKMLDVSMLGSAKLVMLEGDLEHARLGLEKDIYQEIQTGATAIIHNAWQINYKLGLQSFEPSVRGARNLLNLAFGSPRPPRFLFTSSTAVSGFGKPNRSIEEDYLTPEDCVDGMGYGQSKLVTETLLRSARAAGLETCVVRIGQLTGDDRSGAWSLTDWFPALIASSVSIGYLPAAIGNVSWLPLDIAAQSIVDASVARGEILPPVINTSHPRPLKWEQLMSIFMDVLGTQNNKGQDLSILPLREWNERVISAASTFEGSKHDIYHRFPSTKLQTALDQLVRSDEARRNGEEGENEEGYIGTVKFGLKRAVRLSQSLRDVPSLGREHVEKWISYWEKKGLFASSESHNSVHLPLQHDQVLAPLARL